MADDEQTEHWKKLKKLRWTLIILFPFVGFIAPTSNAVTRPFQSGSEVLIAWMFSALLVLIIPAVILVGIKERRARLQAQGKVQS